MSFPKNYLGHFAVKAVFREIILVLLDTSLLVHKVKVCVNPVKSLTPFTMIHMWLSTFKLQLMLQLRMVMHNSMEHFTKFSSSHIIIMRRHQL